MECGGIYFKQQIWLKNFLQSFTVYRKIFRFQRFFSAFAISIERGSTAHIILACRFFAKSIGLTIYRYVWKTLCPCNRNGLCALLSHNQV